MREKRERKRSRGYAKGKPGAAVDAHQDVLVVVRGTVHDPEPHGGAAERGQPPVEGGHMRHFEIVVGGHHYD